MALDGNTVSFRRKLLAFFALTAFLSVGAVTWFVISVTRKSFEQINNEQAAALAAQFRREFERKGEEIAQRVQAAATSEAAVRIALAIGRGTPDYGKFIHDAHDIAENQQLAFLEVIDGEGTVISSAQSPARFGYKDSSLSADLGMSRPFLRKEQLPGGSALTLDVIRNISGGEKPLFVIGGEPVDSKFLASLEVPPGMSAALYQNSLAEFSPALLLAHSGTSASPEQLSALIERARTTHQTVSMSLEDNQIWHAIPLDGTDGSIPAILLIGSSRQPFLELRQHITLVAVLAASAGIILAILFSSLISRSVTRPIERMEAAARSVSSGDWHTQVPVTSADELGTLAESFNRMTSELLTQRDRLIQAERVAAWRELARRLAHELKNPLFPLQLTVENLLRAKQRSPQEFEEVFAESSTTLLAEVTNLKNIISRFGEFSRMPQPQYRLTGINHLMREVAKLFQVQLAEHGVRCEMKLDDTISEMAADSELLHRALSNLVLNAIDAMPNGGTLSLSTHKIADGVRLEVADTGSGLTQEERDRLFTPYYTSKAHGTGLGLAIVQSIVTDHQGKISVHSQPGKGSAFQIEIPANLDKLQTGSVVETASAPS